MSVLLTADHQHSLPLMAGIPCHECAVDRMLVVADNQIKPEPSDLVVYLNETPSSWPPHGASPGGTGWQGKAMAGWAKTAGVPVWLGEGGPHNGGGKSTRNPHTGACEVSIQHADGWTGPADCLLTRTGGGEYASTFVSSFGYMDTLGTLASLNHSVFARQTVHSSQALY